MLDTLFTLSFRNLLIVIIVEETVGRICISKFISLGTYHFVRKTNAQSVTVNYDFTRIIKLNQML